MRTASIQQAAAAFILLRLGRSQNGPYGNPPRWVSITVYVTPGAWALRGDFLEGMTASGRLPAHFAQQMPVAGEEGQLRLRDQTTPRCRRRWNHEGGAP